jgi:hypothetical protein
LIVAIILAVFKDRADLVAENIALRRQLSCPRHRKSRPEQRTIDRVFWATRTKHISGSGRTLPRSGRPSLGKWGRSSPFPVSVDCTIGTRGSCEVPRREGYWILKKDNRELRSTDPLSTRVLNEPTCLSADSHYSSLWLRKEARVERRSAVARSSKACIVGEILHDSGTQAEADSFPDIAVP